ncbi:DeoR/GlpR family DNA-binding transcription regulator [Pseudomonas matsuisoli]|uniref:Cytochrome c n=1 Tax=Pseudomonas matsuisoli TaxID=1515666 RepID=A0A917UXP4_9PSED|nr:DeoR/GlpR family DNA-binding transcription regulator [Pseudomonas matsuisoli]GGJ93727.1 cytochrome c [Pseudomonas matsuisoli]
MPTTEEHDLVGGGPIIPDQRREMIWRQLCRHQVLSVHQLTEMFGCSHMTIRRDIASLEKDGRAYSVPGGVRIASQVGSEPSHQLKAVVEQAEKRGMARRAAELLHADMTLYLDAGTSTLQLVPHIRQHQGMTVVTNDFTIVQCLADALDIEVIHIGGQLDHPNLSTVGSLAAATLRRVAIDIAFMSTSSWDLKRGVTTPSAPKVEVKRAALEAASQTVLVASSSKYGTFGTYRVAPLDRFDLIITDSGLGETPAEALRALGLELELAAPEGL